MSNEDRQKPPQRPPSPPPQTPAPPLTWGAAKREWRWWAEAPAYRDWAKVSVVRNNLLRGCVTVFGVDPAMCMMYPRA